MKFTDLLNEAKLGPFEEFSSKRLAGATKISKQAKEKGGPSMLTYHHFVVKLPYYEDAAKGNFDYDATLKEFDTCVSTLAKKMENMEQVEFQKLEGLIEVLGELLIKHR